MCFPGVQANNYSILSRRCYLLCLSLSCACRWLRRASLAHSEKCLKPERLKSVWSKFMWNFPGPPGEPVFMNCNKKSHFDAATALPWHEERFGYVSVCQERKNRTSHSKKETGLNVYEIWRLCENVYAKTNNSINSTFYYRIVMHIINWYSIVETMRPILFIRALDRDDNTLVRFLISKY